MPSIFSLIVKGEIPCYKIAEDENYFAFLDINPVAAGHTLVIPKQEVDYVFDLEDDVLTGLHLFSKKVAKAIESVVPCQRIGLTVVGLEVPHVHVHLVPLVEGLMFIDFANKRPKMEAEEMEALAEKIRAAFK